MDIEKKDEVSLLCSVLQLACYIERVESQVFNKTVKVENKTKLRQPTNWNPGNRASNLTSAIPRPASRIPAPRLARPTVKNAQGDVKKGYM